MFKLILQTQPEGFKMVKTKRNIKSPRRKNTLTIARPLITRSLPGTTSTALPTGSSIKVVVRIRPPNERENGDNQRIVIKIVDDQMVIFDPKEDSRPFFYHGVAQRGRDLLKKANKNLQFMFDKVFGFTQSNQDVFENSTKDLITSLMDGYNCSVFVYGATGAGKTHTMLGNTENPGITFLTMHELFRKKAELLGERDFELGITYLEVYNETVQDLLNPGTVLQLREDGKYGVMVSGTQVKRIDNPDELFELLSQGNKNRTQHPTDANAESSRSHAVFQVFLRMTMRTTQEVRMAKLSMIDLAGSERGAATGCAGARFTEGANINKSLLALGNCINSLADGQRHVPYRDSKLTRLLKDSLGGNCQTIMIANVSPSSLSYEDTYNTLKYATRAKKIKSHMKKNIVNCEMHIGHYVKLVEELKKENEMLKGLVEKSKSEVSAASTSKENKCDDELEVQEEELRALFTERRELIDRLFHLKNIEKVLEKRIELKEEADSRVSGLCLDTPHKEDGHKKFGDKIDRLQRQDNEIKTEITFLELQNDELKKKLEEVTQKVSSIGLQSFIAAENAKLVQIESDHKVQRYEKIIKLQEEELKARDSLLGSLTRFMRPCFIQAKGHGFLTKSLEEDYHQLMRQLQGARSVTWREDIADSGLSATSSITSTVVSEEEGRGAKRKAVETASSSSLDSTFVLSPAKTVSIISAEQLMAKAYKPPPTKRLASVKSVASPRINKENRLPSRRPVGTMGTASRFSPGYGDKLNGIRKPIRPINRPTSSLKPGGGMQKMHIK